jgi:hypothetical protein
MKIKLKKLALAAASAAVLGGVASSAQAANWLMLQGTEPVDAAKRVNVWGFIQAQYQKDYSDACKTNCNPPANTLTDVYIPPKLVGPDLTSQDQFNVNRARLGARGTGLPLDSKVNYFLLAEFGNNAITNAGNDFAHLTDASITLNHIKGARVRVGLFKYPGAEEGLQAIHVFDYINFTEVTNQMLLERFPNPTFTNNVPPVSIPVNTSNGGLNQFNDPVGAFRDTGIQVFDTFNVSDWEHSYAVMYGNGNGLNMSDPDDEKDLYLYWSSEKVFGGKGPRREGLKFFIWSQDGKRLLDQTNDAVFNPVKHDRKRKGLGVKYLKKPFRFTAEYMDGEGMIFVGPDKATFDQNGVVDNTPGGTGTCPGSTNTVSCQAANGADSEASGYYLDFGWYIANSKWELDLRYDVYNRLEGDPGQSVGPNAGKSFESEWVTWTLGVQYHFNRKTRMTLNYAMRDVETPAFTTGAGPNGNMDGIGDRASIQVTHIF